MTDSPYGPVAVWEVCQSCGVEIPHDGGSWGGPDVGALCDDCAEDEDNLPSMLRSEG